mgnify:FL=1
MLEVAKKIRQIQAKKFKTKMIIKINNNEILKNEFKVKKNKFKFIPTKVRKFSYTKIEKSIEEIIKYLK